MIPTTRLRSSAIDVGLTALAASGMDRAAKRIDRRLGTILTLHRVLPGADRLTGPGAGLAVTPATLALALDAAERTGHEPVGMDEVARRLANPGRSPPFLAVTFDDGYRDTLDHAAPLLRVRGVPFTVYVVPRFMDRGGLPWWLVAEEAVSSPSVEPADGVRRRAGHPRIHCARTGADRAEALVASMRYMSHAGRRTAARTLAARAGIDIPQLVARHFLDWEGLARLAAVPGCTIGSHTGSHPVLSHLPRDAALAEIVGSRAELERRLGRKVLHLAYPHGDAGACGRREADLAREAGYATAVTTRPSPVNQAHRASPMGLPRLGVNRHWRDPRIAEALIGGALTITGIIGRWKDPWRRSSGANATTSSDPGREPPELAR